MPLYERDAAVAANLEISTHVKAEKLFWLVVRKRPSKAGVIDTPL